jgi:hypothetical protein
MAKFPFIGGSYQARSSFFDTQRTVNLYPEISKSATSKSIAALYGCPGTYLWTTLAGSFVRGMLVVNANLSVIAVGVNVYAVTAAKVATLVGTIDTAMTPARMASNGTTVMIVTGSHGYFYTPSSGAFVQITDATFTGADTVTFIDGYFAFNKPNTGQFQITNLYSTSIDPLNFATAEGSPDNLLSLLADHRELWLFGETSTEVFFNSGNANFPFERIQGAFIEQGCAAKFSPAKLDNTVYWLAADERGKGTVQRAQGYQPQRVSNHALEYAIAKYSRIDDAFSYTYQQEGHMFYVLTFPTANATWCYDSATDEWHERAWRDPADGSLNRHRSSCQMQFAGLTLVGDWQNGNIYVLDLDTYTDNGGILPCFRQSPYVASDTNKLMFFNKLWVDMEVGVGINGLSTTIGTNPKVVLDWSDDGGNTWSNEVHCDLGKIGERKARAVFRRLGRSRSRTFRLAVSDPVKRVFIAADVEATEGVS